MEDNFVNLMEKQIDVAKNQQDILLKAIYLSFHLFNDSLYFLFAEDGDGLTDIKGRNLAFW